VTGFGPFRDAPVNPAQTLVDRLPEVYRARTGGGAPAAFGLARCAVVEVDTAKADECVAALAECLECDRGAASGGAGAAEHSDTCRVMVNTPRCAVRRA
jgi:hypothetical protein